jgi:hypothetical protein
MIWRVQASYGEIGPVANFVGKRKSRTKRANNGTSVLTKRLALLTNTEELLQSAQKCESSHIMTIALDLTVMRRVVLVSMGSEGRGVLECRMKN